MKIPRTEQAVAYGDDIPQVKIRIEGALTQHHALLDGEIFLPGVQLRTMNLDHEKLREFLAPLENEDLQNQAAEHFSEWLHRQEIAQFLAKRISLRG